MYYKISDFLDDWKFEREATLKIFTVLTNESLNQKVTSAPQGRSLGQLAWHITTSIGEMMARTGIKIDAPDDNTEHPASAGDIKNTYERVSEALSSEIKEKWNDKTLETEDDMYGEKWKRSVTLRILIEHQIHHRGQMTVLMRQAGLKVPGVFGPSYEEWEAIGMPPMK
jgi:uncharacterized damage-inducible protein DinB